MQNIAVLLRQLTLDEKASLCSGRNAWRTKAIERQGIPSIAVSDGPHGLRRQPGDGDMLGLTASLPATCFPPACATASSWDSDLLREIGSAIGAEARAQSVAVVLGPGVNIKRNPLCGRNFEYFSEDPLLAGTLASAWIQGAQTQGVGASLKHFAANNQESHRMTIDTLVDERALHEIYLPAFKRAVQEARPWTVMSAYNQLNGIYCSEHPLLLTTLLRKAWGFDGVVVSDWGANNDRIAGLRAGLDLEMPGGVPDNDQRIAAAIRAGRLDETTLDETVKRLLTLVERAQTLNQASVKPFDEAAHHELARKAATQSAVLLKNDSAALPLQAGAKLAVIGSLAEKMRYQGSGSSVVNPTRMEQPLEALRARNIPFTYAEGYSRTTDAPDERLIAEALSVAQDADTLLVFAGLTEMAESEGFDRAHMRLPTNQNAMIARLVATGKPVIVVLFGGAPVEMPWIADVQAALNMYLPGQAGAAAVVDLLFGAANPSGKLAETYPVRYEDTLSAQWFPGDGQRVEYRESIFVGYRGFDAAKRDVLFPFGHGLSYTSFAYDRLELSAPTVGEGDTLQVNLTLTNVGERVGAEVIQLYLHPQDAQVFKADRELKAFQKVSLQPGESRRVALTLTRHDFAHYDVAAHGWVVESGAYEIQVGSSSRDIRLRAAVQVIAGADSSRNVEPALLNEYHQIAANQGGISDAAYAALYGPNYRRPDSRQKRAYTVNSTLDDIKGTLIGRYFYRFVMRQAIDTISDPDPEREQAARQMMQRTIEDAPLRTLVASSGGSFTHGMLDGIVMMANGHYIRGGVKMLRSRPPKK